MRRILNVIKSSFTHGNYYGDDAIQQYKAEQASTNLLYALFSLFFWVIKTAAIYSPFIYAGYLIANKLAFESKWYFVFALITIAYLLVCFIYWLKGMLITLRNKGNELWLVLFAVCVIISCVLPALFIKAMVETTFFHLSERYTAHAQIISYLIGILFGVYIYNVYRFRTPVSPKFQQWAFMLGYKTIK